MDGNNKVPYFVRENEALAEIVPADDYLHAERNLLISDQTLTETQYFGFSVPGEGATQDRRGGNRKITKETP